MAIMSVEECRKYLPELNHLPDRKICDNLTEIINWVLNIAMKENLKELHKNSQ